MNVVIMTGECHSRLIDENGFKLVVIRVNLELAFRLSIVVSSKFLKRNLATWKGSLNPISIDESLSNVINNKPLR